MPKNPERLGKAHEKLTRDYLNGDEPCSDTLEQLEYLDEGDQERVRIGAERAVEFIREHTPFVVERATEEGDDRKVDPDDDVDLMVFGPGGEEKGYSLKLTSSTAINVRNTLASKMARDIFGEDVETLFTPDELETYRRVTQEFVDEERSSGEMAGAMTPIFARKFQEAFADPGRREAVRERLLKDVRLDSNVVACKVTSAGNFHGFASMERAPLRKFADGTGEVTVYTKDSNATSIFFDVDGEAAFRIDMYGQYSGSTRQPRVKTVYRVTFG